MIMHASRLSNEGQKTQLAYLQAPRNSQGEAIGRRGESRGTHASLARTPGKPPSCHSAADLLSSIPPRQSDSAMPADQHPPSADEIVRLGGEVLAELPDFVRARIGDVPIVVQDFADDAVLQELGIADAFELSGLYQGVPIGDREQVSAPSGVPDMIFLYRRPILDEWCDVDLPLKDVVRTVLVHEIGHHMGLSDDDIDRIEAASRLEDEG
jgi:predicted Zn-dependent protease with MMP-like domain